MNKSQGRISVLVTGAGGYIGQLVVKALAEDSRDLAAIVATDIRPFDENKSLENVIYESSDVRSPDLAEIMRAHATNTIVHLAAVVTPGKNSNRDLEYSVDVLGTENVLDCALTAGVSRLIYTSSGAAYGYYADNPTWLDETDTIRGNPEFAYSDHKRLVEDMLARWRKDHPELAQLIFRPGTVLGATTRNQITDLFDAKLLIGLSGVASPFVFIWDMDVVGAIIKGLFDNQTGIYNLAGDGTLTMREMAAMMGKPYLPLPPSLMSAALRVLKKLGFTRYGPEQVNFLRYRPVLSNRQLKGEMGYTPAKTSREVFEYFLEARSSGR